MANPVSYDLPYAQGGGAWVKVAEDVLSATIHLNRDEHRTESYQKTYVLTGEEAPSGNIAVALEVIDRIIEVAQSEPIDVYFRYVGDDIGGGKVVVHA